MKIIALIIWTICFSSDHCGTDKKECFQVAAKTDIDALRIILHSEKTWCGTVASAEKGGKIFIEVKK